MHWTRQVLMHALLFPLVAVAQSDLPDTRTPSEEVPATVADMPTAALKEIPEMWMDSPSMAAEMVHRMALELRTVSPAAIEEGPDSLEALAHTLRNPHSDLAHVNAQLQRTNAALAVHHARAADKDIRDGEPARAATQLLTATGHLQSTAEALDAEEDFAATLRRAREVANAVASGEKDRFALREEAQAIAKDGRTLEAQVPIP